MLRRNDESRDSKKKSVENNYMTICINGGCPMKYKCHRFTATSTALDQTYVKYEPLDDSEDNFECEKFIPQKR